LFHSARWKAYLHELQNKPEGEDDTNIYHILHGEKLWFTREKKNGLQKAAEEHLKRSGDLVKDCTEKVDNLEETLANTPKPSEMLNWETVTLEDLM
jgi:hypothetical protein